MSTENKRTWTSDRMRWRYDRDSQTLYQVAGMGYTVTDRDADVLAGYLNRWAEYTDALEAAAEALEKVMALATNPDDSGDYLIDAFIVAGVTITANPFAALARLRELREGKTA